MVERGDEVEISRRGEVVARLVAPPPTAERRLGLDEGRFDVPEDFDAPLPSDVLDTFYRLPMRLLLPISQAHAAAVADLPSHHRDPFERYDVEVVAVR